MSWRRLRGQRLVMHFVGDGVSFRRRVLVIVFLVVFVIGVLVAFSITFVIGIQRFLQLFEFSGLYIRFGHRFDRFGPLFGIGLRFFMLGLGELFGKRVYIFLGKAGAIRGMRVRDRRRARSGIEPVEVARDFSFRVRRSIGIFRRAGGRFGSLIRRMGFVLFGNRCRRSRKQRTRQSCGQFFVRERPWHRRSGGSFRAE